MDLICRYCEVKKNLEMWVRILEPNGHGNYVPVAIEEDKNSGTGGTFVLRKVAIHL